MYFTAVWKSCFMLRPWHWSLAQIVYPLILCKLLNKPKQRFLLITPNHTNNANNVPFGINNKSNLLSQSKWMLLLLTQESTTTFIVYSSTMFQRPTANHIIYTAYIYSGDVRYVLLQYKLITMLLYKLKRFVRIVIATCITHCHCHMYYTLPLFKPDTFSIPYGYGIVYVLVFY